MFTAILIASIYIGNNQTQTIVEKFETMSHCEMVLNTLKYEEKGLRYGYCRKLPKNNG